MMRKKRVPFSPPSKDGIAKSINKNILLGIKNDNNNLTDRNEDPVGIVIKDNNSEIVIRRLHKKMRLESNLV